MGSPSPKSRGGTLGNRVRWRVWGGGHPYPTLPTHHHDLGQNASKWAQNTRNPLEIASRAIYTFRNDTPQKPRHTQTPQAPTKHQQAKHVDERKGRTGGDDLWQRRHWQVPLMWALWMRQSWRTERMRQAL